jgi:hypothetical protein
MARNAPQQGDFQEETPMASSGLRRRRACSGCCCLLVVAAALVLPASVAAQPTRKPADLPPAQRAEATALLASIAAVFDAFASGDAAAMLRHVHPNGRVTASGTRGDGASSLRQQSWTEFADRVRPDRAFKETISDPVIDIDDDIAMVWARFVVRVDGKIANCGVDHFDLVREKGTWKVMNLTFSSRTTGCPVE